MMQIERRNVLGGLGGGLLRAFDTVGHWIVTFFIGARLAAMSSFTTRVLTGGVSCGFTFGGIVGLIAWGSFGGAMGGALLGVFGGLVVGGGLLAFASEAAEELRRTHAEAERLSEEEGRVKAEKARLDKWEKTLREAGVSAHSVAGVRRLDDWRQARYFEQFELNLQDGLAVQEAHSKAFETASSARYGRYS